MKNLVSHLFQPSKGILLADWVSEWGCQVHINTGQFSTVNSTVQHNTTACDHASTEDFYRTWRFSVRSIWTWSAPLVPKVSETAAIKEKFLLTQLVVDISWHTLLFCLFILAKDKVFWNSYTLHVVLQLCPFSFCYALQKENACRCEELTK